MYVRFNGDCKICFFFVPRLFSSSKFLFNDDRMMILWRSKPGLSCSGLPIWQSRQLPQGSATFREPMRL
ncbi:hypothetical protein DPMN_103207 [Dreissena polymorpha]|uniref:Uncharacterized protein n=1 Tax=Dreissena polymorpha TaxID=45954 RepID=A0A9D4H7G8_DREPO|nr:hypothetical protein DPMN_103207 [Dreissena polymorpha]